MLCSRSIKRASQLQRDAATMECHGERGPGGVSSGPADGQQLAGLIMEIYEMCVLECVCVCVCVFVFASMFAEDVLKAMLVCSSWACVSDVTSVQLCADTRVFCLHVCVVCLFVCVCLCMCVCGYSCVRVRFCVWICTRGHLFVAVVCTHVRVCVQCAAFQ